MRRWFDLSPLRAPDDDRGGGGSDTVRVADPGAEQQLDDDEPGERRPAATKTPEQIELETVRAENARLKTQSDQNAQDARYWADRARKNGQPAPRGAADDDEPQPRRRAAAAADEPTETAADLIDDLNKKGLAALKDRGMITKAELDQALEDVRTATSEEISDARSEAVFSGRLEAEFPEMMEDSARVSKGLAPKSELFVKAGEIYRDLVDMDPSLKNSRGLLLIAARQAKAAIGKGGKGGKAAVADDDEPSSRRTPSDADDQQRRRQKIDRQRPDRGREDDDSDGGNHHSAEASEIMKRLRVKPEDYDKHRDGKPRGGRK